MSPSEAIEEVGYLKSMFSGTPEETADFWFKTFQRFPKHAVHAAIEDHASNPPRGDFPDRPGLIAAIETRTDPGGGALRAKEEARQRAESVRRHAIEFEERKTREEKEAEASWSAIDAIIAENSDEDLADLKLAVVATAHGPIKTLLERGNPRTNKLLKLGIFNYLHGREPICRDAPLVPQ